MRCQLLAQIVVSDLITKVSSTHALGALGVKKPQGKGKETTRVQSLSAEAKPPPDVSRQACDLLLEMSELVLTSGPVLECFFIPHF